MNSTLYTSREVALRAWARRTLRVQNLKHSAGFYRNVFGCTSCQSTETRAVIQLQFGDDACSASEVVELIAGPSINDWPQVEQFSIELPEPNDVARVHSNAMREGGRVFPVRTADGSRRCMILDPDGYPIEVYSRAAATHTTA